MSTQPNISVINDDQGEPRLLRLKLASVIRGRAAVPHDAPHSGERVWVTYKRTQVISSRPPGLLDQQGNRAPAFSGLEATFVANANAPGISVSDGRAVEGPGTIANFIVTLSPSSGEVVTVNYETIPDGTATQGSDYMHKSGGLTFKAGETRKRISIQVLDDTVEDSGETFRLMLSNPRGGNAYLADAWAIGTIFNDEPVALTAQVENAAATGAPSITGTAALGETLTADTSGISDDNGTDDATFTYQWLRAHDGTETEISGATSSTYAVVLADADRDIKVRVSFTDDDGFDETVTSPGVHVPQPAPLTAEFTNPPQDGHDGSDSFTLQVKFSYDIKIGWEAFQDHSFTISGGDVTHAERVNRQRDLWQITVRPDGDEDVTISLASNRACTTSGAICNSHGMMLSHEPRITIPGPQESQPQELQNVPATGAPSITGTAKLGETLTADASGISDENGTDDAAFTYQWLRAETEITDATGPTYTVVLADADRDIKVRVSFTDDDGFDETVTSPGVHVPQPAPLTAEFTNPPQDGHDGSDSFTLQVKFSYDIKIGWEAFRDHSFTVSGGDVTHAERVNRQRDLWQITVRPDGDEDVTISLASNRACTTSGAICNSHGMMLSNEPVVTISGP